MGNDSRFQHLWYLVISREVLGLGLVRVGSFFCDCESNNACSQEYDYMFLCAIRLFLTMYCGKHGATKVQINSAYKGTGVIAGGAIRAVMEALGVKDVLAKSHWAISLWTECCKSDIKCA